MVAVESGDARGVRVADQNLRYWLGIPYAASTEGDNAWAPPQPRPAWSGELDASEWGYACTQPHHGADAPANQSQDCLNVNVYAPIVPAGTMVPVMVFIHGGAYLEGSNQGPFGIYSGAYLASTYGVVVIAVGYRLSVWGWLSLDVHNPGNYGLMDQVAALQWVQRNAHVFGGDPKAVTVQGEVRGREWAG